MNKIRKYLSEHPAILLTLSSIVTGIGAILLNKLYEIIANKTVAMIDETTHTTTTSTLLNLGSKALIIILAIVAVYLWSCLALYFKNKFLPDDDENRCAKQIFLNLKDLGCVKQEKLQVTLSNDDPDEEIGRFLQQRALDNMGEIVKHCYSFFADTFTNKNQMTKDIKFETTFMTKSYIDDNITIPFSANMEMTAPSSMLLRKKNPKIYENTETAKIYRTTHPIMLLIEDTKKQVSYAELYHDQKNRIKSSVVLPVLSHNNKLLGTLVVHCNKANFFTQDRYEFWNALLNVYAVELSYYKTLLDYLIEKQNASNKPF